MGQPLKICLITPSLQQGDFIERAVRSVLQQLGENFQLEYVVRDGGSSDSTASTLESLQKEFAHIPGFSIRIEPDAGQAAVLAEEFAHSDAQILGWLNADDVLLPGAFQAVADAFSRKASDVIYGDTWFINETDKIIGRYPVVNHQPAFLRTICYLSQPSVFFTREIYEQVGGINRNLHYAMDYDLWLRFARAGARFVKIDKTLSATRLHAVTKTASGGLDFTDEVIRVQKELFGDVPEPWLLYRKYREIDGKYPRLPAVCSYALALMTYLFRNPLNFLRLCAWSVRIAWIMMVARIKTLLVADKNLKSS